MHLPLVGRALIAPLLVVLMASAAPAVASPAAVTPAPAAATSTATSATAAAAAAAPRIRVFGHRGYPGRAVTENTLASFNRAVRAGARGVELDVRVTKDGRFVVMHDDSLRRTTTCRGATVRGRSLGWIVRRCRGVVRGERIPSLGTTAGWFRRHPGITPLIELKEGGWTNRRLRRVRDVVTQRRIVGRARFLSGNITFLRRVEREAPQLRTQALADSWAEVEDLTRTFRALSGVNLHAADATPDGVAWLRRIGWTVLGRTTNDRAAWSRLEQAGVHGIVTGDVAELSRRQ